MIGDKNVFSTTGKMQQLILKDDELGLRKAIKICQSHEQANKQVQEMKTRTNKSIKSTQNNSKSNHYVKQP